MPLRGKLFRIMRQITLNRKARHNYDVLESFEAGIALKGSEVKSLRAGKVNIQDGFIRIEDGEAILYNVHISDFEKASYFKEDPYRPRKLLLHKRQIQKLWGLSSKKGFTIIPLKMYFNDRNWAKVEVGLCKGRKIYDKRKKIKERETKREAERALRRFKR